VHDSIVVDINEKVCDNKVVARTMHEVFDDLPKNFEKLFLTPFNVPMECEVLQGQDWENMVEIKKEEIC
jgi:hypothetical protein